VPTEIRTVALNALFLNPGRSGGPETYLRGLVPALAREFPDVRFLVVTTESGAAALRADGWSEFVAIHELFVRKEERMRRLVAEQVLLPRFTRSRVDLVHSLATLAPMWTPVPAVITFHDVTFLRVRTFSFATTLAFRAIVGPATRRADALLTGSAAARDEICATLGLEPARFLVVPHGAGRPPSGPVTEEGEIRRSHRLEGRRVVLCVGAKRPHKNQEVLLRAMPHLPEDIAVVLVGHPEPYDAKLRVLAAQLSVADRVLFLDYLPDRDLEGLWRIAGCAAFPTLGEGFGLPVLEAMQRSVPIAGSDIPVLREVGGELPFYFDPRDERSAAAAISIALQDSSRMEAGRARAATFTWERAARGTFEAYERAMPSTRS
jgi:glycosyltransferase involved in cell wall biosynthesis